jgi:glycosyltransferase involved in cell wall biosynthesis
MKIVVFSDLYPPLYIGGYEVGAARIVDELRRRGHEVLVLAANELWMAEPSGWIHRRRPAEDRANVVNVGLCVIGLLRELARGRALSLLGKLALTGWARRRYRAAIRAFQPDALLAFNPLGVVAPVLDDLADYSRQTGVPVFTYVSDNWLASWPGPNPAWLAIFQLRRSKRFVVRAAFGVLGRLMHETGWMTDAVPLFDGYFYCSEFIRKLSAENAMGVARHEVVHWGLPGTARLPEVPLGHLERPGPLTVVFAGQLLPHKGLKVLIQALAVCHEPHRLVVLGDDTTDYAGSCKRLAVHLGVDGRIEFTGKKQHEEMLGLLARTGQVLVVPSLWDEPFSIVVLEGMGVGLPVVASATGGTAEAIRDGDNGFLFPRGDSQALAGVLDRLAADRALCRRAGTTARQEIQQRFTLEGMVDVLLAGMRTGAERASAPARRQAA